MSALPQNIDADTAWISQVGIPVRNLWLLLVYAADLAQFRERFDGLAEDAADLPELLARLLSFVVERRLHKNLTRAYVPRAATLNRVRGRIDWLKTDTGMLLQRGEVACQFEDLTYNTPRNRLVRAALLAMSARMGASKPARECRILARQLEELGVGESRPSRSEMARERISRHDAEDRLMITVAELALDLILPGETIGSKSAMRLDRDEVLLRKIFEKAVAGICAHELHGREGWKVFPQKGLLWDVSEPTGGFKSWLPAMSADVVLEQSPPGHEPRRVILETKFANALTLNAYQAERFKSGHLYQLYAYLRTQADRDGASFSASEGVLIYPVLDQQVDEWAVIQGHRIRIATIDLRGQADAIKGRVLDLARGSIGGST